MSVEKLVKMGYERNKVGDELSERPMTTPATTWLRGTIVMVLSAACGSTPRGSAPPPHPPCSEPDQVTLEEAPSAGHLHARYWIRRWRSGLGGADMTYTDPSTGVSIAEHRMHTACVPVDLSVSYDRLTLQGGDGTSVRIIRDGQAREDGMWIQGDLWRFRSATAASQGVQLDVFCAQEEGYRLESTARGLRLNGAYLYESRRLCQAPGDIYDQSCRDDTCETVGDPMFIFGGCEVGIGRAHALLGAISDGRHPEDVSEALGSDADAQVWLVQFEEGTALGSCIEGRVERSRGGWTLLLSALPEGEPDRWSFIVRPAAHQACHAEQCADMTESELSYTLDHVHPLGDGDGILIGGQAVYFVEAACREYWER